MNRQLTYPEARSLAAAVLGIRASATVDEARAAWRELVLRTHPDRGGEASHFEAVQVAWEVWQRTAPAPDATATTAPVQPPRVIRRGQTNDFGVRSVRLDDLGARRSA